MKTRTRTSAAIAAAQIRKELKKHGIQARVRSEVYSGGSSIDIDLHDELPATVEQIKAFTSQYKYGYFDVMTDCYEMTNVNPDLPQVQFIFVQNNISEERRISAWNYARAMFADANNETPDGYDDEVLLSRVMEGSVGNWLAMQKPRQRRIS